MKMKKLFASISIVLILIMSFSCQHEQQHEPNIKGEALFSFSSVATEAKSMMKSSDIDNAASIIVSIKNAEGVLVCNLEQLPLIKINGSFITRPISLLIGNYELTQFIVADAQGNALFVAPIQGSPNAYLVSSPLPIAFTIAKDEVVKIVPEVVDVENSTPEDFGYSTFSFTVVETFNFLVSVFVYNAQVENFELTTAALSVSSEGIALYSNSLQAITNQVTIRDGYESYILNISKEGYKTFIDTLTNAELKHHFRSEDNGPLVVTLEENVCNCLLDEVVDIDGNIYKTVKMGDQWWMAENLKATHYNDGTIIAKNTQSSWMSLTVGSYEWPNKNQNNIERYGLLYNWKAIESGELCPVGWHVPSYDELTSLVIYCGGANNAREVLEDSICFNALPAGIVNGFGAVQFNQGWYFWSNSTWYDSQYNVTRMYNLQIDGASSVLFNNMASPQLGLSVRCLKD